MAVCGAGEDVDRVAQHQPIVEDGALNGFLDVFVELEVFRAFAEEDEILAARAAVGAGTLCS